jgi:putative acetyltransferase
MERIEIRSTTQPMPGDFSIRSATHDDLSAIRAVLRSVRVEYGVLCEDGASDEDLDDLAGNYLARGGLFEVVEDAAGRIVGCAGLKPLSRDRAELCKMYLEPSARGRSIGKQLLQHALAAARRSGFSEVWLETNSTLDEAIGLYTRHGFQPVEPEHLLPRCDCAYLLRLE